MISCRLVSVVKITYLRVRNGDGGFSHPEDAGGDPAERRP